MTTPRILLFIPAYNCALQLPRVIEKIDARVQEKVQEVVVIENRSTDGTLAVASGAIQTLTVPASVLQNDDNYSLGGSIKGAFCYALDRGFTHVLTVHGDDQADVRDFLAPLADPTLDDVDLLIGARFHRDSVLQGYSAVRRAGNRVLNAAFALVARRRIDDLIAGLNLFQMSFYADRTFLNFPNNLTFDAHLLLLSLHRRANIRFVPVTWREEDQVSNAKTVRQAVIILRLLGRYIFRRDRVFNMDRSGRSPGFDYASRVVATNAAKESIS